MANRRKVNFMGEWREATIVEFEPERENFSTYLLEDGTSLKIKAVVTEVFRIDGQFQANGDPVYGVTATQVVAVNAPESLRRKE